MERAYEIYKGLFGNAQEFTFMISGDFETESVMPLLQKYLGNLPNASSLNSCTPPEKTDDQVKNGPSYEEFAPSNYSMKNVGYSVRFIQKVKDTDDWQERLKIQALGGVARAKAWELRFKKGYNIYWVAAFGDYNNNLNRFETGFNLTCSPEDLTPIRKDVKKIISDLKNGDMTDELFQEGLERMNRLYLAERAGQPYVMLERLYNHYRHGEPWVNPAEIERYVKALTPEDIMRTAKKYLKDENLYEFVFKNEEEQ
jgi:predicted Zn-dependent peptidase